MKKTAIIALGLTISLAYPAPLLHAETVTGPAAGSGRAEICFPVGDGEGILRDLERGIVCREAVVAAEEALSAEEDRSKALENRVVEQDRELVDARKIIEDTRKAGEAASKAASGPWYGQVLKAAKWIALGIVIGFVGGVSK